jgi:hypothetical protein
MFIAALKYFIDDKPWGFKANLARKIGIHPDTLSELKSGKRSSLEHRLKVANVLGYYFERFLAIGENILSGRDPFDFTHSRLAWSAEDLDDGDFIKVPFSDNMKISAGSGGTIPITNDVDSSPVIIYKNNIESHSSEGLRAFRVGGDSMEPIIAEGGLVVVDTKFDNPQGIVNGHIYVLCYDLDDGECQVKYLRWGKKNDTIIIYSPNHVVYPPKIKTLEEIQLIGPVIWSWRNFPLPRERSAKKP